MEVTRETVYLIGDLDGEGKKSNVFNRLRSWIEVTKGNGISNKRP